jgi:spore coat-associated protein N
VIPRGLLRTKTGKAILSLVVLALLAVVLQSVVFSGASFTSSGTDSSNVFTAGTLSHTNSKNGQVVLSADGLCPGQTSTTGSLTITGSGNLSGTYTISKANVVDTPASPGLSNALNIIIEDTTGTPATLYNGPISGFTSLSLGTIAPGQTRSYRFSLSFPIANADSSLQGASMTLTVQFEGITP